MSGSKPLQSAQNASTQNYGSINSGNGKKIFVPSSNTVDALTKMVIAQKSYSDITKVNASILSTSFNIIKAIVGSGILCLPWATANVGLIPTFILLGASGIISFICWEFIVICANEEEEYQYRDIVVTLLGVGAAFFVDFLFIVVAMIYSILYSVYIGEFISNGLNEFGIYIDESNGFVASVHSKFFIVTIIILIICGPLTLLPKLDYLKYSSIIGITATLITVGYICYTFFSTLTINDNYSWVNTHNGSSVTILFWLESFGVFSAAYFGHFNTAPLFGELGNRSIHKMRWITINTFIIITIMNLFMLIPAYLSFGNNVTQNVIASLVSTNNKTKGIVAMLRILMSLNMIGSYPLLFWNLKISMKNLVFFHADGRPRKYTTDNVERLVYFGVNVLVWLIAIFSTDVGEILSLVQATAGNGITFVFPPLFYYALLKKQKKLNIKIKVLCFCIVGFGLFAMIGGLIATISNMAGFIQSGSQ